MTKVAGFCNSLLMISSTSSEKQSDTDLPIVRISTPVKEWFQMNFQSLCKLCNMWSVLDTILKQKFNVDLFEFSNTKYIDCKSSLI